MEFCFQSWNFTNYAPELYQIRMFFATTKKLNIALNVRLFRCFPMFTAKHSKCKIYKLIKEWSWKSHGKIFCQVCGNPDQLMLQSHNM